MCAVWVVQVPGDRNGSISVTRRSRGVADRQSADGGEPEAVDLPELIPALPAVSDDRVEVLRDFAEPSEIRLGIDECEIGPQRALGSLGDGAAATARSPSSMAVSMSPTNHAPKAAAPNTGAVIGDLGSRTRVRRIAHSKASDTIWNRQN